MKTVYGPVSSWRLGRSLGIDPLCTPERTCSFDCVYCQLRSGKKTITRQEFVPLDIIKQDFESLPNYEADVVTFAGMGEPTLAKNLDAIIDYVRNATRLPLAILTNSSLFTDQTVRESLRHIDIVVAKLDAPNQQLFSKINNPYENIQFTRYLDGIKTFREQYAGKFCLQIMCIESNRKYAGEIACLAHEFSPDEIQLNTPLRPCEVSPLSTDTMQQIHHDFFSKEHNVINVYTAEKRSVHPLDVKEIHKRKRYQP
jgi:wyosine [tRNA(Phe)-imidazoG37] synthetase (radical SAM superfamily)